MDAAPPTPPPTSVPAPAASDLGKTWCRPAQLATAFLVGAAAVLLALHGYGSLAWSSRPTELQDKNGPGYHFELNRASRHELLQLPGVGPETADKILAHRRQRPFRSVEDLVDVPGIGPAGVARLRRWVYVDDTPAPPADRPVAGPEKPRDAPPAEKKAASAGAHKKGAPGRVFDLNTCSAEDLRDGVPGLGKKLSEAIVAERRNGPFKSVDDLRRVSGIGKATLDKVRPHVTVAGEASRVVSADPHLDPR